MAAGRKRKANISAPLIIYSAASRVVSHVPPNLPGDFCDQTNNVFYPMRIPATIQWTADAALGTKERWLELLANGFHAQVGACKYMRMCNQPTSLR